MKKKFICTIIIPMQPVPKARPRVVGRHTYTPKKTKDAQALIALYVRKVYKGDPLSCPLALMAIFVHKRPKAMKGLERVPKFTRPDGDNLLKTVMDSMEGIVYKNDGQFCSLYMEDWYASKEEPPSINLQIFEVHK
tara:strand:- start:145 stop:552 length:408 start_codon:yes stop_codon:yes gene_type:complete